MDPRLVGVLAVLVWLAVCYLGIVVWDRASRRQVRRSAEQQRLEYLAALRDIERRKHHGS